MIQQYYSLYSGILLVAFQLCEAQIVHMAHMGLRKQLSYLPTIFKLYDEFLVRCANAPNRYIKYSRNIHCAYHTLSNPYALDWIRINSDVW